MKKKSLIALLALIVACMFVFAACGDKADTNNGGSIADNTEASTELTTDENGEVFTPNEGTPLPLPTDNVTEPTEVTEPSAPAGKTDAEKVADYVAVYGNEFADGFVEGFTSTGLTCTSAIKSEGTGIILTVNVNEYENLTADQKASMQSSYDQATPSLKEGLSGVKALLPELSYVKVEMCEKDGDLIAIINIDFTEGTEITVPSAPTVTEPTTPAENTPSYSVGSVSYKITNEEGGKYGAFTFMYDENQNVTEVVYVMAGKDLPQEEIDSLEEAYEAIEQAKNMGCNMNADMYQIDNEYRVEFAILISSDIDVAFIEGMLETEFDGTTIPLAEAEAAMVALGFVKE